MWQKIKNYYHYAQALIAAIYFNFPSKHLTVIGITGTDGKTTTVNMIYHILNLAGKKTSMVSSVNAQIGAKTYDTGFHVSTPSPWKVQKYLKKAVDAGSEYFVIEATSHGLDQNRLAFINFKLALLTNITREHLDYHKTWQNYALAKLKLFKNAKTSILNADDDSFDFLKNRIAEKVITYGMKNKADFNLKNFDIKLKIIGNYNLSNALGAFAVASSLGVKQPKILTALKSFAGTAGRMEEIDLGQDFRVFIDFAHTPNGLQQALKALRQEMNNQRSAKLIAVFGTAGERDKSKRPLMGEVADKLADMIVLTLEDPRGENPQDICNQIAAGIKGKKEDKDLFINTEREKAIKFAIDNAGQQDIIGIFGKGHEKSMNIDGKELPWDEFEVVEKAIQRRLND